MDPDPRGSAIYLIQIRMPAFKLHLEKKTVETFQVQTVSIYAFFLLIKPMIDNSLNQCCGSALVLVRIRIQDLMTKIYKNFTAEKIIFF